VYPLMVGHTYGALIDERSERNTSDMSGAG